MRMIVWFGFVLGALSAAGKVFFTKVGQTAILECGVISFSNVLVWKQGDDLVIRVNGKTGFSSKGRSDMWGSSRVKHNTKLEISRVTEAHTGDFTCEADRTVHHHTLMLVSVSVTPPGVLQLGSEATLQCQVKDVKDLDPGLTVQWKRPDGSSQAGSQTFQLKSVARSDAGTWQCTLTYSGQTFTELLTVRIQELTPKTTTPSNSLNSKDITDPNCIDRVTVREPSDAVVLVLRGLSWWVWLAFGVGCLAVILLMVFIIVMCKRIRRRKKKFQRMKNAQQSRKPKKYCQCDCPTAAARPQQGRRREKPSALLL